jgi:hypothetical protein
MLLAASPSRIRDLNVTAYANGVASLSWAPSPERDVTGYIVACGPAAQPESRVVRVAGPPAQLSGVAPGAVVSVKAVNGKGMESWDWTRVAVK